MKQRFSISMLLTLLSLIFILPGCAAVGDLMKTSFWAGAIFVVVIIVVIIYVVLRLGKKN